MQKITTFLWFDKEAEEAAKLYTSIFPNSRITDVQHYENANPDGSSVTVVTFELDGQQFIAMNAGPMFKFSEAISLHVNCESQEEVDKYWDALTADGGEESECGWLKDKFGLSWQIVPIEMNKLFADPDRERAGRAMQAMFQMRKLDINALKAAADGVTA